MTSALNMLGNAEDEKGGTLMKAETSALSQEGCPGGPEWRERAAGQQSRSPAYKASLIVDLSAASARRTLLNTWARH